MGRIKDNLEVGNKKLWTLFDSGARNSYLTAEAAIGLQPRRMKHTREVKLGGKLHKLRAICNIEGKLQKNPLEFEAYVVDQLGHDEEGKPIQILFGALAMQKWNIKLDMRAEKLDLKKITTEFIEF